MKRKSNWPRLLTLFLEEKRDLPFDWATNNCAFFAADWVCILTDTDPAAELRGKVTNAASAAKVLGAASTVDLGDEILAALECPRVPILTARRGDVCAHDTEHGPALGVCLGAQVAFAGKNGVETFPLAECVAAWRIL